ncbi:MAG: hypothetical protein K2G80_03530 [Bacteroidales bacterium]|nr:hypothetical protein [Bacteroidales bacterium]
MVVGSGHKAGGAARGLSCAACFEQPAGVHACCGARYQKLSKKQITVNQPLPDNRCLFSG